LRFAQAGSICGCGGCGKTGAPPNPVSEDSMKLPTLSIVTALALGMAATSARAQDIAYQLINSTSSTLLEFYTSPVDVDNWEFDLLADLDVEPGEEVTVMIGDGRTQCEYDLLFVFDTGEQFTDTVDICQLASYELVE
jgi:hypothetical protein